MKCVLVEAREEMLLALFISQGSIEVGQQGALGWHLRPILEEAEIRGAWVKEKMRFMEFTSYV